MDLRRTADGFEYAVEHDYFGEDFIKQINSTPDLSLEEIHARLKAVKERLDKQNSSKT